MISGGVALTVVAILAGERLPDEPTTRANLAMLYLIVFGSFVAFTAYLYLLKNVRAALATSYAYVNPPVAVLLGVLFIDEVVHGSELIAMTVILAGVGMITSGKKKRD
jgi:drug/metabolite transporter (DMT)-like permease